MILGDAVRAAFAAGIIPDIVRALAMLVAPDLTLPAPGAAMAAADAARLFAALPPELRGQVIEATLTPGAVTLALLSAHMIIFWLSQDSNVTPPVCIPAYAAAAIAKASPLATGLVAGGWRSRSTSCR
jgi:TRAP-type uncharacterized transport system fused permease subunit